MVGPHSNKHRRGEAARTAQDAMHLLFPLEHETPTRRESAGGGGATSSPADTIPSPASKTPNPAPSTGEALDAARTHRLRLVGDVGLRVRESFGLPIASAAAATEDAIALLQQVFGKMPANPFAGAGDEGDGRFGRVHGDCDAPASAASGRPFRK